jgi:hypothetical protein
MLCFSKENFHFFLEIYILKFKVIFQKGKVEVHKENQTFHLKKAKLFGEDN